MIRMQGTIIPCKESAGDGSDFSVEARFAQCATTAGMIVAGSFARIARAAA